jgi:ATP-dependent exoDNAse (exonuclease V) alpha subunit
VIFCLTINNLRNKSKPTNKLNQKEALKILKSGQNVFLTGRAGSGKTHVLNEYIKFLRKKDIPVGITASTGIAATHLDGMTIHAWSGMGVLTELRDRDIKKIIKRKLVKERVADSQVLIIDEISMLSARHFDIASEIIRLLRTSWKPFGEIQLVLSGDFFQLPPVNKNGDQRSSQFAYHSKSWSQLGLRICYLEEQWRQTDENHLKLLEAIRENKFGEEERSMLEERIKIETPISDITKLYTHNIDVDLVNRRRLAEIKEKEMVYYMRSFGISELAEMLSRNCLAPQKLLLKKGALVMFVRNNFEKGFINGTLGTVVGFNQKDYPIVEIKGGKNIEVFPETWRMEDERGESLASIQQLPLRLAWAITIHKSQGMTLDAAEMDLSRCFEPGMGYVALSRVRSLKDIYLKGFNEMAVKVREESVQVDQAFKNFSKGK